jgi:hypothetical protein
MPPTRSTHGGTARYIKRWLNAWAALKPPDDRTVGWSRPPYCPRNKNTVGFL